jgi:hypothetical protein
MFVPLIAARMIQPDNIMCLIVESSDIWSLVPIAPRTGQAKVVKGGLPPMLFRENVIDVKYPGVECLGKSTILAQSLRPPSDAPVEFRGDGHGKSRSLLKVPE